jgi:GGDEF domain-containing protein
MIPVLDSALIEIDIANIADVKYRRLLQNQYNSIKADEKGILKTAENLRKLIFDAETNLVSSPNEFVNQADQGLYMSKNNGRNRVTYFDPKAQSVLKSANAKK